MDTSLSDSHEHRSVGRRFQKRHRTQVLASHKKQEEASCSKLGIQVDEVEGGRVRRHLKGPRARGTPDGKTTSHGSMPVMIQNLDSSGDSCTPQGGKVVLTTGGVPSPEPPQSALAALQESIRLIPRWLNAKRR